MTTLEHANSSTVRPHGHVRAPAGRVTRFWRRVAWLEPFWLALLAPAILLPGRFWEPRLQPLLVGALFLFWPVRRLAYGRWHLPTPLTWPMLALLAWTPVTVLVAVEKSRALDAAGYLLLGIALYAALVNWPPARRRPALLALPIVATAVVLVVLGPQIMNVGGGSRFVALPALEARLGLLADRVGEDVNPNVLAGALVLVLPFLAALALEPRWTRHFWWPLLAGFTALLGALPLFLTQSRGAMVATAVAIVLLIVLRWRVTVWGLPVVAVGVAWLFWRLGWQTILDALSSNTSLVGLSGRLEIWNRAAYALRDFAWTGVGHGLFTPVVPWLYPFFTMPGDIPHAHNLLLQVGMDMGVPGIWAYLGVLVAVFVMAGATLRRAADRRLRASAADPDRRRHTLTWALSAGLLAAYTGLVVHGLVDAVTWGTKLAFLPWLCFALTAGLYVGPRRRRRVRRRRTEEV